MKGESKHFDFGIIGGGPAGYTAAIRASQLGKTVVIFEKEHLGGVCLNKGCIPTKTFLHSADLFKSIKKASGAGIEIENATINFEKIVDRKNKTVEKLRKSLEMLLKSHDITIVFSEARIMNREKNDLSPFTFHLSLIEANGQTYACQNVLIATGAEPKCVGGFEFDHEFILSSDDVLNLSQLPQKVTIVGSGAIGIEWARIFSAFGAEVSVIEIAENLLPLADFEISARLERIFKQSRIKMFLSTSVKEIKEKKVTLSTGEVLEPDFVLFATGRKAIVGVETPTYNLIGDAFGSIQLAHFASHQAVATVENIINSKPIEDFLVPSVIYGNPEIAWIGKTEQELLQEKIEYKKSVFPISALGKAHADGDLEGFIKVLSKDNKFLGAHIISKEASALIHQFLIAMQNGLSVDDLKNCCFAHPTYSEGVYEVLLRLDDLSLALPKVKSEE